MSLTSSRGRPTIVTPAADQLDDGPWAPVIFDTIPSLRVSNLSLPSSDSPDPSAGAGISRDARLARSLFPGWVSWLLVACIVSVHMWFSGRAVGDQTALNRLQRRVTELQCKVLIAFRSFAPAPVEQSRQQGPPGQRMCMIVVVGELSGPKKALEQLQVLRDELTRAHVPLTRPEAEALDALQRLYADYEQRSWDAPSVTHEQRQLLERELGWVGELALAPHQSSASTQRQSLLDAAWQSAVWTVLTEFAVFGVGFVGLVVLGVMVTLVATGRFDRRMRADSGRGGIYLETFALWLLLHFSLQIVLGLLPWVRETLLGALAVFGLSALALFWPRCRGVPWRDALSDIGLDRGRRPLAEIAAGGLGYLATLPVMFVSLIIVLGLMWLRAQLTGETADSFRTPAGPAHPAIEWIANGDWRTYWLLMAVASLAAPVMEEVMFRGCLYQYLRELTARKRLVVSIIVSAAVSSLIFAAVHPQGLLGIPPLMAIATSLCLLREWRGSLLAPITAHAINNGAVITLAFGLL